MSRVIICRWLGHDRESYQAGYYFDRRGRQRERWYQRCKRCGTSDGAEVYREGIIEFLTYWRLRGAVWRIKGRLKAWWREDCDNCHKACVQFGQPVGNHENCNPIPF